MADELISAPTGGSEPASAPSVDSGASSAPAPAPASAPEAKAPSAKEAIRSAMAHVEARAPTETERAAAVLKDGPGADDRLTEAAKNAATRLAAEAKTGTEASERAAKGWETRRANEAKAATEPKLADPALAAPAKAAEPSKHQPPARMSNEAKAAWEAAPEPLRAEVVRMHDEMTAGLTKHKESADRWSEISDYEAQSKAAYNQPLKETLKNYVEFDKLLAEDLPAGIERLVRNQGYESLRQFAESVLGTEEGTEFDTENSRLKSQLDDMTQRLSRFEQGMSERQRQEAEQRTQSIQSQVADFAKANPRFDELWTGIEDELHNPRFEVGKDPMTRLQKAYEKVERLNPAPSLSPPAPDIPAHDREAQTRRGQASVTGAPGAGSNPAVKRPAPTSAREAIEMAMSRTRGFA